MTLQRAKILNVHPLEIELLDAIESKVSPERTKEIKRCIEEISKLEKEAKSANLFTTAFNYFSQNKTPSLNVQYFSRKNSTPLHLLVDLGDIESVKEVLKHSPNLELKDRSANQYTPILLAADKKQWEMVKILAEEKANLNTALAVARTNSILSIAIDNKAPLAIIKILLEKGANPNLKNGDAQNAFEQLLSYHHYPKRINVAALLLEHKAEMGEDYNKKLLEESLTEKGNDPKAVQFCREKLKLPNANLLTQANTGKESVLSKNHFLNKNTSAKPETIQQSVTQDVSKSPQF